MESFKYYINIDIINTLNNNNINNNPIKNVYLNNEWSLFQKIEKTIIIKKNIGKLIGYFGETISKLRNDNKDIIIKINSSYDGNCNRKVLLYGSKDNINNAISQIILIMGRDNVIV